MDAAEIQELADRLVKEKLAAAALARFGTAADPSRGSKLSVFSGQKLANTA